MMRSSSRDAARRSFLGIVRGVFRKANDDPKMQTADVDLLFGERHAGLESVHDYGFSSVPLPPSDKDAGEAAEAIVVFPSGSRSHGVILKVGDRRYRLRGMKGGEVALHDDQGQKLHLTRDGIVISSKKKITHQIEGGSSSVVMEPNKVTIASSEIEFVKAG